MEFSCSRCGYEGYSEIFILPYFSLPSAFFLLILFNLFNKYASNIVWYTLCVCFFRESFYFPLWYSTSADITRVSTANEISKILFFDLTVELSTLKSLQWSLTRFFLMWTIMLQVWLLVMNEKDEWESLTRVLWKNGEAISHARR